jgi:hypothetical protein
MGGGAIRQGMPSGRPKMEDRRVWSSGILVGCLGDEAHRGRRTHNVKQSPSASSLAEASIFGGEFDPGSGLTLAACLMHASRTGLFREYPWRTGEEHVGNLPIGGG